MIEEQIVVGIDLGTTFSAIAYIDQYGKPEVIANREGDRTTPSVIYFDGANPGMHFFGCTAHEEPGQ